MQDDHVRRPRADSAYYHERLGGILSVTCCSERQPVCGIIGNKCLQRAVRLAWLKSNRCSELMYRRLKMEQFLLSTQYTVVVSIADEFW